MRGLATIAGLLVLLATGTSRAETSIELITIGPGDALYSRFGHTALRVLDPERGLDVVFNYGYGPFGRPDFLWGFLRGELGFFVAVESWDEMVWGYRDEDRTIQRQPLNLSPGQVATLFDFLIWNIRPEN